MSITIDEDLELRIRTAKIVHGGGSARVDMDKRGEIKIAYPMVMIYKSKVSPGIGITPGPDGFYDHDHRLYSNDIPAWVMGKFVRSYGDPYPSGLKERLDSEVKAIIESLQPGVEADLRKIRKRRMSQLTGSGATKRVDKAVELLSKHLHGFNTDFDIKNFYKIVQVHAKVKFVMENNGLSHNFIVSKKTLEAADVVEMEWDAAARVMVVFDGRTLSNLFHHVSSNPAHWELTTLEDFKNALNCAIVSSVMEV